MDLMTQELGQTLGDSQSQPQALAAAGCRDVQLPEFLEQAVDMIRGNPGTAIPDFDPQGLGLPDVTYAAAIGIPWEMCENVVAFLVRSI